MLQRGEAIRPAPAELDDTAVDDAPASCKRANRLATGSVFDAGFEGSGHANPMAVAMTVVAGGADAAGANALSAARRPVQACASARCRRPHAYTGTPAAARARAQRKGSPPTPTKAISA